MTDPTKSFWHLAESFLTKPSISKGKLMGFPCLRVNGEFFATADHRSGNLIIKVSADRVQELIAQDIGVTFAPAGKVFKEWVEIPSFQEELWVQLLEEAQNFVKTKTEKNS